MGATRRWVGALIAACTAGCVSLLQTPDVGYGEGDAATVEGGASPTDATSVDANEDAGLVDVAQPDDASDASDGLATADGGHWFYDDFDRDGAVVQPTRYWTSAVLDDGGVVAFTSSAFVSAPQSLRTSMSGFGRAAVELSRTESLAGLRCSFDYRIESRGDKGVIVAALELISPPKGRYVIDLLEDVGNGAIREYGTTPDGGTIALDSHPTSTCPTSQWCHVSVEAAFGPGGHAHTIWQSGSTIGQTDAGATDMTQMARSSAQKLDLGVQLVFSAGSLWSILVDNVVCDALP